MTGTDVLEEALADLPAVQRAARRKPKRRRGRARPSTPSRAFWRWAYPALIVAMAVLVPVLVWYVGADAILDSSDGDVIQPITDPEAPGYVALVDPTPSTLLVQVADDDSLAGVTLLALADEAFGGGTVVFIPAGTTAQVGDGEAKTLAAIYADDGVDAVEAAVAGLLDVGVGDVERVDSARWAELLAPLGSIDVTLPDQLVTEAEDGTRTVIYEAGPVTLAPEDVGPYLSWQNPGETELNRVLRNELFWDAWLAAVGSTEGGTVPGEGDVGLARFVTGLASGVVAPTTLPLDDAANGEAGETFHADAAAVADLVAEMMPFPLPVEPGARPVVRILDGVGEGLSADEARAHVVGAGAQVTVIGNAAAFGVTETQIVYHDENSLADAERFQQALGGGSLQLEELAERAFDITIVLGSDLAGGAS